MTRITIILPLILWCRIAFCQNVDLVAKFEFDYMANTTAGIKSDPVKQYSVWTLAEISGNYIWSYSLDNKKQYFYIVEDIKTFPEGADYQCVTLDNLFEIKITLYQTEELEGITLSSPEFEKTLVFFTPRLLSED